VRSVVALLRHSARSIALGPCPVKLPWPPYGASEVEVLAYEQAYNERSRWRFQSRWVHL